MKEGALERVDKHGQLIKELEADNVAQMKNMVDSEIPSLKSKGEKLLEKHKENKTLLETYKAAIDLFFRCMKRKGGK